MQQPTVKKGGVKKPLILILSVLAAIFVPLGIAAMLALSDPGQGQSAAEADAGNALAKLGVAAVSGQPARITAGEVNGLLAEQLHSGAPRLSIRSDNTVEVYIPASYKGIHVGVTANVTVGCDASSQQIYAVVHSLHLGRLPVEPSMGLRFLQGSLPESVAAEGNVVSVDSAAPGSELFGEAGGLQISELDVDGGCFVVYISGNLNRLRDFIVQTLPGALQSSP